MLLLAVPATGQCRSSLTLSEAIATALANRKNIQASKANQAIRKLQTEALYRKYRPQVSMEYNYLYNPILQTSILPIGVFNPSYPADATKSIQFGTKWTQTAGVTVNQPLLDQSVIRQIDEAKLQERIAATTQAQTEYELAYMVAQVYFDIGLQETKIDAAIADTVRTWVSYQLLQNKSEQKRLLKSELNKGRMNHNDAVRHYGDAISQMIEDKVYLLFLMGRSDIGQYDFAVDTSVAQLGIPAIGNQAGSVPPIPELQQLELNATLTAMQVKTERAQYLPTLSIKGFLGANQYTDNFDPAAANSWFGQSYVGIALKYPILDGENKKLKIRQLQMQTAQYGQQREDRAAQYSKDALIAQIKMERTLADLKTQEDNIALSLESIAVFQNRVSEGQESASDLNREEADLQKLQADYHTAKRQYRLYLLDYLNATGRLAELWK